MGQVLSQITVDAQLNRSLSASTHTISQYLGRTLFKFKCIAITVPSATAENTPIQDTPNQASLVSFDQKEILTQNKNCVLKLLIDYDIPEKMLFFGSQWVAFEKKQAYNLPGYLNPNQKKGLALILDVAKQAKRKKAKQANTHSQTSEMASTLEPENLAMRQQMRSTVHMSCGMQPSILSCRVGAVCLCGIGS